VRRSWLPSGQPSGDTQNIALGTVGADLGAEGTERLGVAMVGAGALGEHVARRPCIEILENDVQVDIGELTFAEFLDEGGLGLLLEEFNVIGATFFSKPEDAAETRSAGTTRSMMARASGVAPTSLKVCFGLPASFWSSLIAAMMLDGLVAERERLDELLLGDLVAEPSIMSMSFSLPT